MEFWKKILSSLGIAGAGVAAVAFAVMGFLLRRRTRELQDAKISAAEAKHAASNQRREENIAALKTKVEADGKDALTKARLLRSLLDDGRDDSGRGR